MIRSKSFARIEHPAFYRGLIFISFFRHDMPEFQPANSLRCSEQGVTYMERVKETAVISDHTCQGITVQVAHSLARTCQSASTS